MDYNSCSSLNHFSVKEDKMDFTNNNLNRNIKPNHNSDSTNGISKAELRKSNKPIMEKRRRARINHCLNELKSLILEAMKKDPARHTKLEKADILEMTVKHLQSIQRQQFNLAIQTDPTVVHKFKTGFTECAEEVSRFLGQLDGIDSGTRHRLMQHLNGCATRIEEIGTFSNFSSNYHQVLNNSGLNQTIFGTTFNNAAGSAATSSSIFNTTGKITQDVDNNGHINMNGVKLIPSRLPSGELALIMPNSTTLSSSLLMPKIKTQSLEFTTAAETTTQFPRLSAFSKPTSTVSSMHSTNTYILNQYQKLNSNSLCNNNIEHLQNNQKGNLKLNNLKCHLNQLFAPTTNGINCNTTTVSSPPLSPVSSISSIGDDSTINTSAASDYGTKTPPLEKFNTSDYFSTPPSSESVKLISRIGHLQQQHVSSTVDELIRNKNDCKKRLTPIADDCFLVENQKQPCNKIIKLESDDEGNSSSKHFLDDSNDSMWRPW